jgi:hypothetical protein
MLRSCLVLCLLLSAPAVALDEPVELSPDEYAALREAEAEGASIFRHDRAAWIATDELRKLRAFRRDKRLQGWVTEDIPEGLRVTFVGGKKNEPPQALYRLDVLDDGEIGRPVVLREPEALSDFEATALRVREAALESGFAACSKTYNSVVMPPRPSSNQWTVYLLPGTEKKHAVPVGGMHRFMIDPEQPEGFTTRAYTRSCIVLDNPPNVAALMITHLLDPTPTEAHVFWSLYARKPLYVGTMQGSLWEVSGPSVRLVKRGDRD